MELAPAGVPLSFEVTFDNAGLHVAMSVFDMSSGSPVLVYGPSPMTLVAGYTYSGSFTPPATNPYVVLKAVYTDNTFSTFSSDYSQGSESIIVSNIGGSSGSSSCNVVGYVIADNPVVGLINC